MKTSNLNLFLAFVVALVTVQGFAKSGVLQTQPTSEPKYGLWLDGTGYADAAPMLGQRNQVTMMGWFKTDGALTTTAFLMGQDHFHLKLAVSGANKTFVATAKNQSIAMARLVVPGKWYHIAVVFDAQADEKLTLYVNGKKEAFSDAPSLADPLPASATPFTIGKNPTANTEFFKGGVDEIRVFSTALSADAIQKMVFQEVEVTDLGIRGATVPRAIASVDSNMLLAYFRMDPTDSILLDRAPLADSNIPARVYNGSFVTQEAPMPLTTTSDSLLSPLLDTQTSYPWAIWHVTQDLQLAANLTVLGMIIDANASVALTNDNKLENTWYLKLDGKIDLQGKSQLVQTQDSELDPSSAGYLQKGQKGQANRYNYNYWSSPVGPVNTMTNNNAYSVDGVLRDATDFQNLQPITWTTSLDGQPTAPITLSSFWIFKFQNMAPNYANWSAVGAYGNLLPAQGFTLKGNSAESGVQHMAFIGKPYNGTITTTIAPGNLNLTGNPYPSAIDADQFIKDNIGKINGTLYFWEHDEANNTHILVDYQGGYATRNLVGGTPTFALRNGQNQNNNHKTPGRFVPVGQGFFVRATTGGTIEFSNSQRAFMKENAVGSNPLFKQSVGPKPSEIHNNANDTVENDSFARIRLGFDAPNDFHRQVLLGFMDEFATSGINIGYDAVNIDTQPYDLYLMNGTHQLVISGEGYFDESAIYPIGIKAAVESTIRLMLDDTEHFDDNQPIYIYDALTGNYHDLRAGALEVIVSAGTDTTRFTLRFHNPTLANTHFDPKGDISLAFTSANNTIVLENNQPNTVAETVELYNMLGQNIAHWDIAHLNQTKLQIPILHAHAGTYVVKVHTTSGDLSKKIIVR
ncbi:LamG-like jellyroll fold domain-containing protein [Flavobacterium caeni]|nr:LamG-like jellyroll fold domain-containing protein [Flavobacterium caeni]